MKKYMFIFQADGPVDMSGEFGASVLNWFRETGEKLIDSGNPFNPESEALVKNGVVTHEVDTASGYTLVKADSLEEAVEIAKACPLSTAPGCGIKVYETMEM